MPYKDTEKKREADRLRQQRKRAAKKMGLDRQAVRDHRGKGVRKRTSGRSETVEAGSDRCSGEDSDPKKRPARAILDALLELTAEGDQGAWGSSKMELGAAFCAVAKKGLEYLLDLKVLALDPIDCQRLAKLGTQLMDEGATQLRSSLADDEQFLEIAELAAKYPEVAEACDDLKVALDAARAKEEAGSGGNRPGRDPA